MVYIRIKTIKWMNKALLSQKRNANQRQSSIWNLKLANDKTQAKFIQQMENMLEHYSEQSYSGNSMLIEQLQTIIKSTCINIEKKTLPKAKKSKNITTKHNYAYNKQISTLNKPSRIRRKVKQVLENPFPYIQLFIEKWNQDIKDINNKIMSLPNFSPINTISSPQ